MFVHMASMVPGTMPTDVHQRYFGSHNNEPDSFQDAKVEIFKQSHSLDITVIPILALITDVHVIRTFVGLANP